MYKRQYESCAIQLLGLEEAVDLTECVEGPAMDDADQSAADLVASCLGGNDALFAELQDCKATQGHDLEVANARATPDHPGVPFVLVDGDVLADPRDIKNTICQKLQERVEGTLPAACTTSASIAQLA